MVLKKKKKKIDNWKIFKNIFITMILHAFIILKKQTLKTI
jgi:hypothetical protein